MDTQKKKESKHTTTDNHQITKEDRKRRKKGITKQPGNNLKNSNSKSTLINNYSECKWTKLSTQQT